MRKTRLKLVKNRDDFYSMILQALSVIAHEKESELLLFNIWGPQGSGKTYALNEIKNRAKDLNDVKVIGPFDIAEHSSTLLDRIVAEFNKTNQNYKKLILLDNLKSIISTGQEDAFIYDVEEKLISPVISSGDAIVVLTSLHEIKQWRSLEVRIRHKTILIPPLERKNFKIAVREAKVNYATAYKRTIGHPKLLEWLIENPNLSDNELDKKAVSYFLNGLEPETNKIAQAMCLSYSFSIPAYQNVLKAVGYDAESSYFNDLKKIKEMGSVGLVIYESNTGMYRFSDPILREVLARSFRREHYEVAVKVYNVLAELSEREAKFSHSLPYHLLNAIYYQLWRSKLSDFSFPQWFDEWLNNMSKVWKDINWEEVDRTISLNPTNKYILAEMKRLAGPEMYKKILLKIRPNRRTKK